MAGPQDQSLTLRRIAPERNARRFYRLAITSDLFGHVLLLRQWGRIGTDGRRRHDPYPNGAAAMAALQRLLSAKLRRGYRPYHRDQGDAATS
ncbi:WGR domain-containing protein [Acidisoma sp. 7E03]